MHEQLGDEIAGVDLGEVCITAPIKVQVCDAPTDAFMLGDVPNVGVVFRPAEGGKCLRSWRILPEVGSDPDYPDLTPRDADAVRYYLQQQRRAA